MILAAMDVLGHEVVGVGPARVVVLNDWLCDTSTWDTTRPYLDHERFTSPHGSRRDGRGSRRSAGARRPIRAAVAGYFAMFARDGLPFPTSPVRVPVLAITGELDAPPMRRAVVEPMLGAVCARLELAAIAESGHYPMQEAPPLTVALLERFFAT